MWHGGGVQVHSELRLALHFMLSNLNKKDPKLLFKSCKSNVNQIMDFLSGSHEP